MYIIVVSSVSVTLGGAWHCSTHQDSSITLPWNVGQRVTMLYTVSVNTGHKATVGC